MMKNKSLLALIVCGLGVNFSYADGPRPSDVGPPREQSDLRGAERTPRPPTGLDTGSSSWAQRSADAGFYNATSKLNALEDRARFTGGEARKVLDAEMDYWQRMKAIAEKKRELLDRGTAPGSPEWKTAVNAVSNGREGDGRSLQALARAAGISTDRKPADTSAPVSVPTESENKPEVADAPKPPKPPKKITCRTTHSSGIKIIPESTASCGSPRPVCMYKTRCAKGNDSEAGAPLICLADARGECPTSAEKCSAQKTKTSSIPSFEANENRNRFMLDPPPVIDSSEAEPNTSDEFQVKSAEA